jgi:hypothetical protein
MLVPEIPRRNGFSGSFFSFTNLKITTEFWIFYIHIVSMVKKRTRRVHSD